MTSRRLPLHGVRVVELGHIVAGPSAALMLAELGADVIKVESPDQGDAARNMPGTGAEYYLFNRNKRSLAVNLKSPAGRDLFGKLVQTADVVVDNYAPGVLDKLGIGYDWAQGLNPRIIYCAIKGYLPGPKGSQPLLDELAQMAGGLAHMTGLVDRPMRVGASVVDIGAATYAVLAVTTALYQRRATGRGCPIVVGLYETTAFWVGQFVAFSQLTGEVPLPMVVASMGGRMGWGVYQLFPTRDGRQVFIAVTSDRHWQRFCKAFGFTDWLADPTLDTNNKRVAQRPRLLDRITRAVESMTFDEVCALLRRAEIPHAPVNTPRDLLDDPHLKAGRRLVAYDVPGHPGLLAPTLPLVMDDKEFTVRRPPPALGEHSDEVLRELGYADADIAALKDQGVVRSDGGMLQIGAGPGAQGDR